MAQRQQPRLNIGDTVSKPFNKDTPIKWKRTSSDIDQTTMIGRLRSELLLHKQRVSGNVTQPIFAILLDDDDTIAAQWDVQTGYVVSLRPLRAFYYSLQGTYYIIEPKPDDP